MKIADSSLPAALLRPEAWPGRGVTPEFLETHISWILFVGDRVYKLKKPVDFGFLDFSTLERRRFFCDEEVRLNRRMAPTMYLGVVPVRRHADGSVFVDADADADAGRDDTRGAIIEWAVEMVRLPARRMLDRLLAEGTMDNALMDDLTRLIVDFHAQAAGGPEVERHGTPDAVASLALQNLDELQRFVGSVLSRTLWSFLRARTERFLADERPLLEARVRDGRIRDGHGDLHAGNLCVLPDGPVAYDCLEFSDRFRCSDVASDLAFLAMDLDLRGFRGFSRYLVRRYAILSGDADVRRPLDFYKTYRALVRAKVAALQDDGATARRYLALAASYQLPSVMMLTCGLPGTGKSTVARELAVPFEAQVLRSDVLRKRLAGIPPNADARAEFGAGLYTPENVEHTYQVLLDEAISTLEGGRSVIVDASFSSAGRRRRFLEAAVRLGHPVLVVHLDLPEEVVRARLLAREQDSDEPSDAGVEVYEAARAKFESPEQDVEARLRITVGADEDPGALIARALDLLTAQVLDG